LDLNPGEIPRSARNNKIIDFFRSLFSLSGFRSRWTTTKATG
jgi:response regulator RpfG family c-di-GMP phosphodiesterase